MKIIQALITKRWSALQKKKRRMCWQGESAFGFLRLLQTFPCSHVEEAFTLEGIQTHVSLIEEQGASLRAADHSVEHGVGRTGQTPWRWTTERGCRGREEEEEFSGRAGRPKRKTGRILPGGNTKTRHRLSLAEAVFVNRSALLWRCSPAAEAEEQRLGWAGGQFVLDSTASVFPLPRQHRKHLPAPLTPVCHPTSAPPRRPLHVGPSMSTPPRQETQPRAERCDALLPCSALFVQTERRERLSPLDALQFSTLVSEILRDVVYGQNSTTTAGTVKPRRIAELALLPAWGIILTEREYSSEVLAQSSAPE
ncbi:unnamed protein product [Lota lota]